MDSLAQLLQVPSVWDIFSLLYEQLSGSSDLGCNPHNKQVLFILTSNCFPLVSILYDPLDKLLYLPDLGDFASILTLEYLVLLLPLGPGLALDFLLPWPEDTGLLLACLLS